MNEYLKKIKKYANATIVRMYNRRVSVFRRDFGYVVHIQRIIGKEETETANNKIRNELFWVDKGKIMNTAFAVTPESAHALLAALQVELNAVVETNPPTLPLPIS